MKKATQIIAFIFLVIRAFSQGERMEFYYPEKTLFKKLKVKSILDSIPTASFQHYKEEYDSLGRLTSRYYIEDSTSTRFRYLRNGDTLKRYHYYTKAGVENPIHQTDIFVYHPNGKILSYLSFSQNQFNKLSTDCTKETFFYDPNFQLTAKLIYSKTHSNQQHTEQILLSETSWNLVNAFAYQYDRQNKLTVKQQKFGSPENRLVDSFYYDLKGRLIKRVSRQRQGFLGEFAVANICKTTLYRYENDRQIETSWTTYSDRQLGQIKKTDEEVNEYILYPNGLKFIWYHKSGSSKKSLLSYLIYEFYQ